MFNRKKYMDKYSKEYREDNREGLREKSKQYYKDNGEKIARYKKQYYLDHQEWYKNYHLLNKDKNKKNKKRCDLKRKYDLTQIEWEGLWYAQDGRCAICDKFFAEPQDINVDHNHENGEIRGLLCNKCNFGIGLFNDNPELLENAIEYLCHDKSGKVDMSQ